MTSTDKRDPFTEAERRALLDEFFRVSARLDATPAGEEESAADRARFAELRRDYRDRLPRLVLSRCPITDVIFEHSFDPYGLDGLWWDYRSPNRPLELLKGTVVAVTGAVRLGEPLEHAPFLCRPGPGVPFVVPRILRHEHARAVLFSLPVGVHTGFAIVYFADPLQPDIEPFNDWGTDFYQFESDVDRMGWDQAEEESSDYDYDIEKYIVSSQLLWIAPGDDTMTLRHGVEGCPYLDLEGSRLPQLVHDGEVWYDELPAEPTADSAGARDIVSQAPTAQAVPTLPVQPSTAPSTPAPPPAQRSAPSPASSVAAATAGPASNCASCGGALKPTSKFCPSCGKPVIATAPPPSPASTSAPAPAPAADVCRYCGQPRRPQAKFCRSCGKA